jgi:hypothetical protein
MDVIAAFKGVPEAERLVEAVRNYKGGDDHERRFLRGVVTFYKARQQRPQVVRFLEYVLYG